MIEFMNFVFPGSLFICSNYIIKLVKEHRIVVIYTECQGGNVPDFGRMFLTLKYTDITLNTYIRS